MIEKYSGISPKADLVIIQKICEKLQGRSFLHINSTREGGGVAEILHRMLPLLLELGIDARWEVIEGDDLFYDITKKIHNTLQGRYEKFTEDMWVHHYEVNMKNAERINLDADMVLIHDPQPAPLIKLRNNNIWVWRCHIDTSNPILDVWKKIESYVSDYDASIFSMPKFSRSLLMDEFIIPPSIDPLSEKNMDLSEHDVQAVMENLGISMDKPILLQVSRFDKFKDPIGVIKAYKMVKKYNDCKLVLAGSSATDDPEGEKVLNEVIEHVGNDADIHVLLLPTGSDKEINALQRAATVVLQKSLKEGFGLTVSEAMWKEKPVIGGFVGGIPFQINHGVNGFLVHSVEGAAFRIRQFLNNPDMADRMGKAAKEYVRNNFLLTRQIRDYLSIWYYRATEGKNVISL
jgi:trehalose synthase